MRSSWVWTSDNLKMNSKKKIINSTKKTKTSNFIQKIAVQFFPKKLQKEGDEM